LEYLLLPLDKRNELDRKYVSELLEDVYKLSLPAESKVAFIKYTEATQKDEIQKLRGQVVYHIFNSEIAFGLAKGKESNIEIWYDCIKEMLEPNITLLTIDDQKKIIALLTREKAQMDNNLESQSLFERLMKYM
jgi:hypothetical protein